MSKKNTDNNKYSVESYKNKIITFLKASKKKAVSEKDLATVCRSRKGNPENYKKAVHELQREGLVIIRKQKIILSRKYGYKTAKITRLSKTFGFGVCEETGEEVFFPGKFMLGAMPDDRVLYKDIVSYSTFASDGEVVDILEYGNSNLTGKIEFVDGKNYFVPDTMSKSHITIENETSVEFSTGDKVLAEIAHRGKRHTEHTVRILYVFGNSESAQSCAESILMVHGVNKEFPKDVMKEAGKIADAGIQEYDYNNREDFRDRKIFTIDSAESKDLDDAVSVEKTESGYILGVHIADVSNYVKGNSAMDKEALNRGTSIYYADKVIPMLPKELSNGICSLNPNENRLTLSSLIKLDKNGDIVSYRFCKSVIRSRVKGVYSEINRILDGTEDEYISEKYRDLKDEIFLMNELADILIKRKLNRHAPQIETTESKIITDENGKCIDVMPRTRGKSECIIEEFMLLANETASNLARTKDVPFVYRIHEEPPEEKIERLKKVLLQFNINVPFTEVKPVHIEKILESARGTDAYEAINMMVLRSMSKAKYSEEPLGHFGLALEDYSHFTSPIRRYPDLAIHRIITDILAGYNETWLKKRYSGFVHNASERSSDAEIRAVTIERECEDCYKAEYMKDKIGESFTGKISGVVEYGFYVSLPNTVEGFVHIRTLPMGEYDYTEPSVLREAFSGTEYKLGDMVNVICSAVSVNDGIIDFVLDEKEEDLKT